MKKILLLEDDPDTIEVVKYVLTMYDFDVYSHSTGSHVVDVVSELKPNLILLDIHSQGRSGEAICKELKGASAIPVVLFSAISNLDKLATACDADGFIEKPFDVAEFIVKVASYVN